MTLLLSCLFVPRSFPLPTPASNRHSDTGYKPALADWAAGLPGQAGACCCSGWNSRAAAQQRHCSRS